MDSRGSILEATPSAAVAVGRWLPGDSSPAPLDEALPLAIQHLARPVYVVAAEEGLRVAQDGEARISRSASGEAGSLPLAAYAPPLLPEQLGDRTFCEAHGLRFAYVAGAMAKGITSESMVEAMSDAGMLGFFGAAGLDLQRVEQAIDRLQDRLGDAPYGFNLIHSPNEPDLEAGVVDLYIRRGVRLVSASAYLGLTLPLLRYRLAGICEDGDGRVVTPNKVVAKVSRVEVARKFFSPPPAEMLAALVQSGALTEVQARLASRIPVAEDLTAEADSGGHTDNRPALALLPTMLALRDEIQVAHDYGCRLRVGAAGGIATPASAAAAFAMGAAYVLTGSVNQACVESGTSEAVREMLAKASQADVIMAPAADMFEMGVQVQVLKWGTMFALKARKLYEIYRNFASLDDLPQAQRQSLERDYFRRSLDEEWASTRAFFATRDPKQIERADKDAKHRMALVFRSYLGQASVWANTGEPSRKADYQVWCGPAMGAFNEWVKGSPLELPANRHVATVAMNLLAGAAALTRSAWIRCQGVALPAEAERFAPRSLDELAALSAKN